MKAYVCIYVHVYLGVRVCVRVAFACRSVCTHVSLSEYPWLWGKRVFYVFVCLDDFCVVVSFYSSFPQTSPCII